MPAQRIGPYAAPLLRASPWIRQFETLFPVGGVLAWKFRLRTAFRSSRPGACRSIPRRCCRDWVRERNPRGL